MLPGDVSKQYGTAFSKILLAFGPPDRLAQLRRWDPALTAADVESITTELEDVRRTEVAFDLESGRPGICATGAPVRGWHGRRHRLHLRRATPRTLRPAATRQASPRSRRGPPGDCRAPSGTTGASADRARP